MSLIKYRLLNRNFSTSGKNDYLRTEMVMGLKIKYYPSLERTGPFSLPFQVTGNAIPKLIQTCHKTCLLAPPLGLFIVYRVLSDSKYG